MKLARQLVPHINRWRVTNKLISLFSVKGNSVSRIPLDVFLVVWHANKRGCSWWEMWRNGLSTCNYPYKCIGIDMMENRHVTALKVYINFHPTKFTGFRLIFVLSTRGDVLGRRILRSVFLWFLQVLAFYWSSRFRAEDVTDITRDSGIIRFKNQIRTRAVLS